MDRDGGPVFTKHLLAEGFPLYELHRLETADDALGGIAEAADSREQIQ
jgi:hypothetical protein